MKINGVMLTSPLMSEMEVGQQGYLNVEAIILVDNNKVFIDTRYGTAETEDNEIYIVPIKRIGPGEDDFEINFDITCFFCNRKLNGKKRTNLENDEYILGPYPIDTEAKKDAEYRTQNYPRMNMEELIDSLIGINQRYQEGYETDIALGDKDVLRVLIQKKLDKLSLSALKDYEKQFSPITEKQSESGFINYVADEYVLDFIIQKIKKLKTQQKLEDRPIEELREEMARLLENQEFEKASTYRDIIIRKEGGINN